MPQPFAVSEEREKQKIQYHLLSCSRLNRWFTPLVLESYGSTGKEFNKFFRRIVGKIDQWPIAPHWFCPSPAVFWRQAISVALQVGSSDIHRSMLPRYKIVC
jgi:hypothetical protein